MKIALIVCTALVLIVLISCISSTIEKCNRNKWKAKNPEAFRDEEPVMFKYKED